MSISQRPYPFLTQSADALPVEYLIHPLVYIVFSNVTLHTHIHGLAKLASTVIFVNNFCTPLRRTRTQIIRRPFRQVEQ
jgi:hypothetical protein